jgi:hypothetical protein
VIEDAVPPVGDHEYVYGAVPPVTVTPITPVLPPLHATLVIDVTVTVGEATVVVKLSIDPFVVPCELFAETR